MEALVRLVQAVDSGNWEIDLAMELAKEVLGFDPTRLVDAGSDCSIEDPCDQCRRSLN